MSRWTRMRSSIAKQIQAWRAEIQQKHAASNKVVARRQRQSVRRQYFVDAMEHINSSYGGEPRRNRRLMATNLGHRNWQEHGR